MSDVFVVGALHLDVVVDAPRLPGLDETLMGQAVAYRFGGKGGNQALAAARAGAASTAMAGRVGTDGFGATVLEALARARVDHRQVRQVPGATGMSVAIVEDSGEYGAVVVSGVNQSIDPEEVDPGAAKVLLMQNEIPEAVNAAVAASARPGSITLLNAAPARPCAPALLQAVDILVVNRVEAAQMLGAPDGPPGEAAQQLAALGPRAVVVTAGREGAYLFDGSATQHIAPPMQADGSAHGAGDMFVGALASQLARGLNLRASAVFASAAAAHFVQTPPEDRAAITRAGLDAWIADQQGGAGSPNPAAARPRI